jgi:quercetin dioxygenase-like cupin family protein
VPTDVAARRYHHPIQDDTATFLLTSGETGGERTLIEIELAPGGGNAPHRHLTYDEHFEVLAGEILVTVDDETRRLGPGDIAVAPMGALHNFTATHLAATFRVELRPGHLGFERALQAGYRLAEEGRTTRQGIPRNPYHAALLLEWSDIRLSGPTALLQPLFTRLARRARRTGVEAQLLARYCDW